MSLVSATLSTGSDTCQVDSHSERCCTLWSRTYEVQMIAALGPTSSRPYSIITFTLRAPGFIVKAQSGGRRQGPRDRGIVGTWPRIRRLQLSVANYSADAERGTPAPRAARWRHPGPPPLRGAVASNRRVASIMHGVGRVTANPYDSRTSV